MSPILVAAALLLGSTGPRRALPVEPMPVPTQAKLTPSAPSASVGVSIGLVLADHAGLDALLAAQHDPQSPMFRHWMTPEGFGDRFGLSPTAYDAVCRTLASTGLSITRFPDRLVVQATGLVSQMEKLLGIKFFEVDTGREHYRTYRGTPRLDVGAIQSISGLDTRVRIHKRLNEGFADVLGPQDLRRFYDMDALHQQGFGGQLSAVGVMGPIPDTADDPDPVDINFFYSHVSDSTAVFNLLYLPNPNGVFDQQGDKTELELDGEMSTIAAPLEQSVNMVLAPADQFFVAGPAYMVNFLPDLTAISLSFGNCEAQEDPNEAQSMANLVAQGDAEGQSWFAASGDNGADDCQMGSGPATVDFPASMPYMVAVGGTQYNGGFDADDAVTAWSQETAWNGGAQGGGAGGGGVSTIFAKPSYQKGPGVIPTAMRELPDISLHASPNPGVAFVDAPGQLDVVGGTSDAAPMAAGVAALLNDAIGGCRLGAPHFQLYPLGTQQADGGIAVFHDITSGNLDQNGITGPVAGPGFDEATGWGSIDMARLAAAWPPCVPGAQADGGFFADGGLPQDDGGVSQLSAYLPGSWEDAGPRAVYDPCALLACDGGSTCDTVAEGPAGCNLHCVVSDAGCPLDQFCASADAGDQGICVIGCVADVDCASGQFCDLCFETCNVLQNDAGAIGDPCTTDSACPNGAFCFQVTDGFPGGYCSEQCDPSGQAAACVCPGTSSCSPFGHCFATCSVSQQTGCRSGYACWDLQQGDTGECRPPCESDQDCNFQFFQDVCDTTSGACLPPTSSTSSSGSVSSGTASTGSVSSVTSGTASTSTSTGSAASTSSGSATSTSVGSTSASVTASASSGTTAGSSGSHGSVSSTGGTAGSSTATSSSGHPASSSSGTVGSAGTTIASSSTIGTSTGGSSSAGGKKSGCGCDSGSAAELLPMFLGLLAFRRRRAA